MQVTCPNCGETVPAEHINIQQMVAVCPVCDSVFSFDAPAEKTKRRKVKQPEGLTLYDGDPLEMAFRTNWRLEQDESFTGIAVLSVVFSMMAFLMIGGAIQSDVPVFIPVFFAMFAAAADYAAILRIYNKTHITMDADTITISRKPLPGLRAPQEVSLSGVVAIETEETEISKKEAYDTPRFRVWAETVDGTRRTIVTDLVEEYAYFVQQRLQERLQLLNEVDVSRLDADINDAAEDELSPEMLADEMHNSHQG